MKNKMQMWKVIIVSWIMLFLSAVVFAEGRAYDGLPGDKKDSASLPAAVKKASTGNPFSVPDSVLRRFIHQVGIEVRPGYIIPTNTFLKGENEAWEPIRNSFSTHLKYSFQFHPATYTGRIYREAYQGIGLAWYSFGEPKQIGNPVAFYLFQGARITRFTPGLSLNYEWNFGLAAGWKPYDYYSNSYNIMIGSKMNAYININFYLKWMLSRRFDLTPGIALTHFSNANTRFPNAGLNTVGFKLGLVYNFNRNGNYREELLMRHAVPEFPRHVSYDLVLFGSWRRKGVALGDKQIASPHAYGVMGFNFAAMYNLGYKLRVGLSADGVYDESANVYTEDYIVSPSSGSGGGDYLFYKPSPAKQMALGLSGRVEYVMPYFTVGLGMGANVLHGGGDLKALYQVLALKIEVTRSSFIHVGYSLQDFHMPNFLMLGVGFRFNNKYPAFHRR